MFVLNITSISLIIKHSIQLVIFSLYMHNIQTSSILLLCTLMLVDHCLSITFQCNRLQWSAHRILTYSRTHKGITIMGYVTHPKRRSMVPLQLNVNDLRGALQLPVHAIYDVAPIDEDIMEFLKLRSLLNNVRTSPESGYHLYGTPSSQSSTVA